MKRFAFYFAVSLFTHILGVGGVLLAGFLSSVSVLPYDQIEVKEILEITPIFTIRSSESERLQSLPRFMPTGRACGNGYVQGYETAGGQSLAEGVQVFDSPRESRAELAEWVASAVRIVERVPNHKNRWGELGERIVLIYRSNKDEREGAGIYWYGGGDSISFIEAPTLEIALEFERSNAYAY